MVVINLAERAGAQQAQKGAQAFAASINNVVANVLHKGDSGVQLLDDKIVDGVELAIYDLADMLHGLIDLRRWNRLASYGG